MGELLEELEAKYEARRSFFRPARGGLRVRRAVEAVVDLDRVEKARVERERVNVPAPRIEDAGPFTCTRGVRPACGSNVNHVLSLIVSSEASHNGLIGRMIQRGRIIRLRMADSPQHPHRMQRSPGAPHSDSEVAHV